MRILAIETSCDETAVSVIEADGDTQGAHYQLLGNALFSQAHLHEQYGGVYPTLAKREHQKNLVPLSEQALKEAGMLTPSESENDVPESFLERFREEEFKNAARTFLARYAKPEIDLIAVTKGPGLEPALWTGIVFAEALGKAWDVPVIGIDHMEGHIVSALLKPQEKGEFSFEASAMPILSLLISGGHTELMLMKDWFSYELVGRTKDDAIGEAFDKVARLLKVGYPGGPHIARLAASVRGSERKEGAKEFVFPRPLARDETCDFSFSGLKTAVLYTVRDMEKISDEEKAFIAEAFEDAARDVIVLKTRRALTLHNPKVLAVGGGVSANEEIRRGLEDLVRDEFPNTLLAMPDRSLTGDNAVMIGAAGHLRAVSGHIEKEPLVARGSQSLA